MIVLGFGKLGRRSGLSADSGSGALPQDPIQLRASSGPLKDPNPVRIATQFPGR